jgi:hypothetical protein
MRQDSIATRNEEVNRLGENYRKDEKFMMKILAHSGSLTEIMRQKSRVKSGESL